MELNSFPSKFINKPFSFVTRLNRMNALAAYCHFSIFIGSFLYQLAKPPQGSNRSIYKSTWERVDFKDLYGRWRFHLVRSLCDF